MILDLFIAAAAILVTCAAILLYAYLRTRPRPRQPLSDSAGSAQFAAARRDEEARGRR